MIVDASVALKWLVPEDDSDRAMGLIDEGGLIAPDLVFAEVSNALWKKWRAKELSRLPASLAGLPSLFDLIEPMGPYLARATAIAIELVHPAYDCFYLAMAESRDEMLVTADKRFANICKDTAYRQRMIVFGEDE